MSRLPCAFRDCAEPTRREDRHCARHQRMFYVIEGAIVGAAVLILVLLALGMLRAAGR